MRIYPQSITGTYRSLRNYGAYFLLFIYFSCSWIRWHRGTGLPDQAILMDLPGRKAYLFGIEIWPEEAYYLAGILILAALGLFFVTSLFGRIWCGYTCPHSVFVDLFLKTELYFQGDRNARIKLDQEPWHKEKTQKKLATYGVWLVIAFSFAFGWVCYFYDAPSLARDIMHFKVESAGLSWLVGLTASTFLFAGYVREKVCTYMCPYGRFQSAMLDNDSSVVTYHPWRGEPRGKYNPADKALGDCIDCGKCVVVCPMGIDIREGLQMQCIGCGLCVDACNSVMERLDRPLFLIAYDSINSTLAKIKGEKPSRTILQFKTALFATIFIIVSGLMLYALAIKPEYKITVLRDRGALYTMLPDGSYRNNYIVKISNKTSLPKKMRLSATGADNIAIKIQGQHEYSDSFTFILQAEDEIELEVFVKIALIKDDIPRNIKFSLYDLDAMKTLEIESTFITRN